MATTTYSLSCTCGRKAQVRGLPGARLRCKGCGVKLTLGAPEPEPAIEDEVEPELDAASPEPTARRRPARRRPTTGRSIDPSAYRGFFIIFGVSVVLSLLTRSIYMPGAGGFFFALGYYNRLTR